jgi:hypothetical protein
VLKQTEIEDERAILFPDLDFRANLLKFMEHIAQMFSARFLKVPSSGNIVDRILQEATKSGKLKEPVIPRVQCIQVDSSESSDRSVQA